MPALSGPRSDMPISIVDRCAPRLERKSGFFKKRPTIPHIARNSSCCVSAEPAERTGMDTTRRGNAENYFFLAGMKNRAGPRPGAQRLVFRFPRVADDGEEADRQLAKLVRPVRDVGIEIERIPGGQGVGPVAVAVADLPLEHVEELDAGMLEQREDRKSGV